MLGELPPDIALAPQFADVTDQIEKKITGITIYESQLERLFDGPREMADAVRSRQDRRRDGRHRRARGALLGRRADLRGAYS